MIGDGPGVKAPRSGAVASLVALSRAGGACASLLPLFFFSLFIAKVCWGSRLGGPLFSILYLQVILLFSIGWGDVS